jgi:hypothetical protein
MATKHITDIQVCKAYAEYRKLIARDQWCNHEFPYEILHRITGQPGKVCYRAMERAEMRGYIDYGVSLRTGWLTDKGLMLIKEECREAMQIL